MERHYALRANSRVVEEISQTDMENKDWIKIQRTQFGVTSMRADIFFTKAVNHDGLKEVEITET